MEFKTLIDMLGRELNIPDLISEDDDEAGIIFDDHLEVRFTTKDQGILVITGHLGEHELSEKQLEQLLAANIDGIGTGGAFISQDEDGDLEMQLLLPLAEIDFPGFLKLLEDFVNHQGMWYEQLEKNEGSSPAGSSDFGEFSDSISPFVQRG